MVLRTHMVSFGKSSITGSFQPMISLVVDRHASRVPIVIIIDLVRFNVRELVKHKGGTTVPQHRVPTLKQEREM